MPSNDDLLLAEPIRPRGKGLPVLLRTVGGAIDMIQAMAPDIQAKPSFHEAEELLFTCLESRSAADLIRAGESLLTALRQDHLLHE
jgi:hypothetical protein